jgi:hypothetical protein
VNLSSNIVNLYGEVTLSKVSLLKPLCIKRAKLLCSLSLLRCRDHSTVPQFLHYSQSQATKRIYHRTSLCLLHELIHFTRHQLNEISWDLLAIHLQFYADLSDTDWSLVDCITFKKSSQVSSDSRIRQCNKGVYL